MALWGRLGGNSDQDPRGNIALETFIALIGDWIEGGVTGAEAATTLNMDANEVTQALRLKAGFDALATLEQRLRALQVIRYVLNLHEAGLVYETGALVEARLVEWFAVEGVNL